MKEIQRYYETHVKKWVEIAQDLYEAGGQKRIKLIKDFGLEDVRDIDIELIVEYFRRFDAIERDYVWESSPANPLYYCSVDAQAFLDIYTHARESGIYGRTHHTEKEERAIEEIHETVNIADGFYETLDALLSSDVSEQKKQYANLVRGIYNNEIKKQIDSEKSKDLSRLSSKFKKDLDKILRKAYEIVDNFFRDPSIAKNSIDYFLSETINEGYIVNNYYGIHKLPQRKIIERLLVELRMMQTAINDYLEKQKPF